MTIRGGKKKRPALTASTAGTYLSVVDIGNAPVPKYILYIYIYVCVCVCVCGCVCVGVYVNREKDTAQEEI